MANYPADSREYTITTARVEVMMTTNRLRPEAMRTLVQLPEEDILDALPKWQQEWNLVPAWCGRWAFNVWFHNSDANLPDGPHIFPCPEEGLVYAQGGFDPLNPPLDYNISECIDGTPGFLRWLKSQELGFLLRTFQECDLWETGNVEPDSDRQTQRKKAVHDRLRSGCSKLISAYMTELSAQRRPKSFYPDVFKWLVERVVPTEPNGRTLTWGEVSGEEWSEGCRDDSTVGKMARRLAKFIQLPLP